MTTWSKSSVHTKEHTCLYQLLACLAPFSPFLTSTLAFSHQAGSLAWPNPSPIACDHSIHLVHSILIHLVHHQPSKKWTNDAILAFTDKVTGQAKADIRMQTCFASLYVSSKIKKGNVCVRGARNTSRLEQSPFTNHEKLATAPLLSEDSQAAEGGREECKVGEKSCQG